MPGFWASHCSTGEMPADSWIERTSGSLLSTSKERWRVAVEWLASRWICSSYVALDSCWTAAPVAMDARLAMTSISTARGDGCRRAPVYWQSVLPSLNDLLGRATHMAPTNAANATTSPGSVATVTGCGTSPRIGPALASHWAVPSDQANTAVPSDVALTSTKANAVATIEPRTRRWRSGGPRRKPRAAISTAETASSGKQEQPREVRELAGQKTRQRAP